MKFYHAQLLKLQGNAVRPLIFQNRVSGFALLLIQCQDKKKGLPLVQNMRVSLKNVMKQQGLRIKVTLQFEFFIIHIPLI